MRIRITKLELEQMLATINENESHQNSVVIDTESGEAWVRSRYHDCIGGRACYLGNRGFNVPSPPEDYILLPGE